VYDSHYNNSVCAYASRPMVLGLIIQVDDSRCMIHGIIRRYHTGCMIPSIIIPCVGMIVGQSFWA